ncbi:uncharacterized protein BJ171DRAFT_517093 [Polychytrium aggregatum]|uniref:uncharacterized protein n=1 Tax=Polychytrium aggregatum TaxID=110093 RepID=UPI0022FEF1D2|nr:uncharacterized protein BJ171DRAFT_517093 [Polychytrium aggregatum]KAI9199788.1 hypothetical protein BJ171DRAFT_517093 [Polychytrium aggregatum]
MASSHKIKEGMDLMAVGQKAENSKSFFGKRTPDWDTAANSYERAATCFKIAKANEQAIDAFQKAGDAYRHLDSFALAAKQYEGAATIAVQNTRQYALAAQLYRQTADFLSANNSPDRAAESLEKAAKALESLDPNQCIELYFESCAVYENEDRIRTGAETFRRAIATCIRLQRLDKALILSQKLAEGFAKLNNRPGFCKQSLATIIIALAMGDEVEATKRFNSACELGGFSPSEENEAATDMLQAFDAGDDELLSKALQRMVITFLDNDVARLAKSLRVPGGRQPTNAYARPGPGNGASTWGPPAASSQSHSDLQDEIEESGFL